MDLSQPQQQHAATRLAVSRPSISSSPSSSTAPPRRRLFKSLLTSSLVILALMSLNVPTVSAQAAGTTLSLTLLNEAGEAIGASQSIPKSTCTLIEIAEGTTFATATTSDLRSALNLYQDVYCQIVIGSTTGQWANSGTGANITRIRWEGTAPASATVGQVSTSRWPENMAIQTQVADPNGQWVMDPSKGIIVVALVAAVMVIGVLIGIYQVYKAAQFVPPPKKQKKPTGLNTKKIKKKDAYFKKPVRDDQQSFQRLHNESPEPFATRHQPMTERSRDSQYSEAATTFVDWNNNSNNNSNHSNQNQRSNNNGRGGQYNSDSISIDMRDTSHQARSSPSPFHSGSSTLDLINFDQDSSSHRGHNGYNDRGRGGEVLVPMHTFDSNNYQQHQGRRRTSSSRSR
ncbi:hypothetical protein BGZ68_001153 [Mortierella alpina]|nr:hypothetical protein BGZ68_001153 [Mortierella alpina]